MDASAPTPESSVTAPTTEPAAAAPPPPVFFRAGKKKRAFRQRAEETDEPAAQTDLSATVINTSSDATTPIDQAGTSSSEPAVSGTVAAPMTTATTKHDDDKDESGGLSVAEVIRLRNAKKHRLGGVAFRAGDESSPTPQQQNGEQAMVLHDGAGNGEVQKAVMLGGVNERFAPQTGMVGELVNKHM